MESALIKMEKLVESIGDVAVKLEIGVKKIRLPCLFPEGTQESE